MVIVQSGNSLSTSEPTGQDTSGEVPHHGAGQEPMNNYQDSSVSARMTSVLNSVTESIKNMTTSTANNKNSDQPPDSNFVSPEGHNRYRDGYIAESGMNSTQSSIKHGSNGYETDGTNQSIKNGVIGDTHASNSTALPNVDANPDDNTEVNEVSHAFIPDASKARGPTSKESDMVDLHVPQNKRQERLEDKPGMSNHRANEVKDPLKPISDEKHRQSPNSKHSLNPAAGEDRFKLDHAASTQHTILNKVIPYNLTKSSVDKPPLPLPPTTPEVLTRNLQNKAMKYIAVSGLSAYFLGRWNFSIVLVIIAVFIVVWAYRNLASEGQVGLEWQIEKNAGMKSLYTSDGESVEWFNYMLEKIWRAIDPKTFVAIEDMLEDTMVDLAPSLIKEVKVSDFDIGVQAPRITSIRMFPPLNSDTEESIFGEATFSFHASPVASATSKRGNLSAPPGLSISLKTGLKAVLTVKGELTALSGKVRFKLITGPDAPFLTKAIIAFTTTPVIETGVMPLTKHVNIMHFPVIKKLVNDSVAAAMQEMVEPKSMTLDLETLLAGTSHDVTAIGVLKVDMYEATRRCKDVKEMKDAYASACLSHRPGKTFTSTRVLTNDEHPIWNEVLYVLVTEDDILMDNNLDLTVWDADKVAPDEKWGRLQIPVRELTKAELYESNTKCKYTQEECEYFDGWSSIDGKDEEESKIKLHYKVTFHPKYATVRGHSITRGRTLEDMDRQIQHEANPRKREKLEKERKGIEEEQKKHAVDDEHHSGILNILIISAIDLEINDPQLIDDKEAKHPYSPSSVVDPYACVYVNDTKVFRSKAKMKTPSPHWNAGTEQFIREFKSASVRITVKNTLDVERDPILGMVYMDLPELFDGQTGEVREVTRWLPLRGGIGSGKVLVQFMYKPVKMNLPRNLCGYEIGTLVVDAIALQNLQAPFNEHLQKLQCSMEVNIAPRCRQKFKNLDPQTLEWKDEHIFIPIQKRYKTALYCTLQVSSGMSVKSTKAFAKIWLRDLTDGEWHDWIVGLDDFPDSKKNKDDNRNEIGSAETGKYGSVRLKMKFIPGFSARHEAQQWFRADMVGLHEFDQHMDPTTRQWLAGNVSARDNSSRKSIDSSFKNGDEDDDEDEHYEELPDGLDDPENILKDGDADELATSGRTKSIHKRRVVRKFLFTADKLRERVEKVRGDFNADQSRLNKVQKEG